jgi:hypothetical protein
MAGSEMHEMKILLQEVHQDVKVLKEDVKVLKEDVIELKEDVRALKKDVSVLKDDMKSVQSFVKHYSNMQEIRWTHVLMEHLSGQPLVTFRPIILPLKRVYRRDGSELTDLDGIVLYGNSGLLASVSTRNKRTLAPDFVNLAIDDSPISNFDKQVIYVIESKSYVDKLHVDKKMRQMMVLRDHVFREIKGLNDVDRLPKDTYGKEWKKMVRQNRYLLKISTDRVNLFFGATFLEPNIKRYIELIHTGEIMDKETYERLAFELASSTDDFNDLMNKPGVKRKSITTFEKLRDLCTDWDAFDLLRYLEPHSDMRARFEYFQKCIGYLDEKANFGIV